QKLRPEPKTSADGRTNTFPPLRPVCRPCPLLGKKLARCGAALVAIDGRQGSAGNAKARNGTSAKLTKLLAPSASQPLSKHWTAKPPKRRGARLAVQERPLSRRRSQPASPGSASLQVCKHRERRVAWRHSLARRPPRGPGGGCVGGVSQED